MSLSAVESAHVVSTTGTSGAATARQSIPWGVEVVAIKLLMCTNECLLPVNNFLVLLEASTAFKSMRTAISENARRLKLAILMSCASRSPATSVDLLG